MTWGTSPFQLAWIRPSAGVLTSDRIYIALSVLIYTGPPVYQAANYFVLGRALHYIPQLSPIHPGRVVSTFVGLDVLVEILVGSGASRIVRWDKSDELAIGLGLIKAALLLQVVLFLGFIGLQALFHRRCIRHGVLSPNLRSIMILMYMSNTLILFRNVFRVIDNFLPNDAGSKRFETYEWCLDVLPIALNGLLLTAFFPAVYLPRSNKVYIGSDGRTERHGPGWQDKRPFLQTLFDPFDCIGLARGADTKNRFWEHEQDHPVVVSGKEEIDTPKERSMLARVFDPFGIGGFKASFSNPPLFKDLSPATA